jgi:2-(1,2-epoxy-1,2-dihydrophenyl)acetyl-CoA isomerase
MVKPYHAALAALGELPVPVVCAAQGAIAGGALGLLWAADVVVLAEDAKLVTAFTDLGLVADGGLTWALPRLVGLRRALQLTVGGRRLTAAEALEWELVDEVVPTAALHARGRERAAALAEGPTVALGHLRRLLRTAHERSWREQLDEELAAQLAAAPHATFGGRA